MGYPSANDVLNDAAIELGLVDQPVADFYSTAVVDPNLILLRALLASLGRQLVRAHNWVSLQSEHTFTTIAGQSLYALPEDYDRTIVATAWDRTNSGPMNGSVTAAGWQALKGSGVSVSTPLQFRVRRNQIEVFPDTNTPGGIAAAFEYIRTTWATKVDFGVPSIPRTRPLASTDLCYYDAPLLVAGLQYRYRTRRGMDAAVEEKEYRDLLELSKGADRPSAVIRMGDGGGWPLWGPTLRNESLPP